MPRPINRHSATNLIDLFEKFGNDEKCRIYLEKLRWPNGVKCVRCESDKISRIYKRNQFHCDACQYHSVSQRDNLSRFAPIIDEMVPQSSYSPSPKRA